MYGCVSVCEGGVSISASTAIQYAWAGEGNAEGNLSGERDIQELRL
jgi:hypothetical protein